MRKIAFILLLLFVLSSCERRPSLEERLEEAEQEYFQLEEQYSDALVEIDQLSSELPAINDAAFMLYDYFEDPSSMSFEQAQEYYEKLISLTNR